MVREAKSYSSTVSESEVIEAFSAYDLLIIDEVGVQSGTEAESRALFDVFNERYQNLKPTILISNLDAADFVAAVGNRIADRIKEDGGEFLFFNWESAR
ncbi:DNA replication protein DnaC [Kingella negevensis]|uniref:DNA replication protein DnaC n=1 Tax=Kingella negevensis TaxID=1522312 RepID=A0A238HHX9_9NEIS|nr:DNA replication protein DnaC [Kingella negevensis]